jgi:hypothetical protein
MIDYKFLRNSSFRRTPESSIKDILDPGFRRGDDGAGLLG